jgi:RHH-type proline utilization regulon transcriptional repressor/proline dehydrogenase/delta 1-pyrroline-5-carboxylate dehydrogenase
MLLRDSATPTSTIESLTQSIGGDLLATARSKSAGLLSGRFWSDKLMAWAMQDAAFKTQLFRFVDVMPSLHTPQQIYQHLHEYLTQPGVRPPAFLKLGLSAGGLLKGTLARTVTSQIESMAARFVAAENLNTGMATLKNLWDHNIAFSVDLLGEACVSSAEASEYQRRYIDLITALVPQVNAWPLRGNLDHDHLGPIPRANVSIKISSLSANIRPADFEGTLARLQVALTPILQAAATNKVLINFDMEHHALQPLTIELFKRCCQSIDFPAGLAIQAYLKSGPQDAEDLVNWSHRTGRQITVRLIKGAYWDYEVTHAGLMNWPIPVWSHKSETDACFERMTDIFLKQTPRNTGAAGVKLAIGSHNLRSIAHALAVCKSLDLPENALEFQMLRGMAEELKTTLSERGYRVREYVPLGKMLPGMAYLVRRLLENTSNESWLRAGFGDEADAATLLAPPQLVTASKSSTAKTNEPPRDFSDADQRSQFQKAITASRVPSIKNDSSLADLNRCMETAHAAFVPWRNRRVEDRAALLQKTAAIMRSRRDELSGVIIRESAKPWDEADGDVCEAIDFCEYYARQAIENLSPKPLGHLSGEDNQIWYQGRGVTAIISPWNFPLAICCGMTVAALLTGNTTIVKPAEQTPGIARLLCEILWQAGVPKDVLHFLPGIGETIGAALVKHPLTANIAFTGSKAVGLSIVQEAAITSANQRMVKRVVCEMGGKNAIIVDSSADLDEAVLGVRQSAFGYAGQKCSAASRVIVLREIYPSFLARLVESAKSLQCGDPLLPGTDIGPVIDDQAAAKIRHYIELGRREAKLELAVHCDSSDGRLIGPHIFSIEKYDPQHPPAIAVDEIFGPVLTVICAKDLDEALAIANASDYKLTGGCYSRTPSTIDRVRREFNVGNLYLNRGITGALVGRQPFGGFALSGIGAKAGGPDYLKQFVDCRVVTENTLRRGFVPE